VSDLSVTRLSVSHPEEYPERTRIRTGDVGTGESSGVVSGAVPSKPDSVIHHILLYSTSTRNKGR
jgi:hypothetical protein